MLLNPGRSVVLNVVTVVLSVWLVQSAHGGGLTEQVRTYAMTVELEDREISMIRRVSWQRVEEAGQEAWRVSTEHESSDLARSVDTIHLAAEDLRPLRRYISQGNTRIRLHYSDDMVRGKAWLQDGRVVPIEVGLDTPIVGDVATAMATLPIAPRYTNTLSSFDPTLVSVRRWKISAWKVEVVETPMGAVRTFPLEVSASDSPGGSSLYWVTEEPPHYVVKSESDLPDKYGGGLQTVLLESVSPLPGPPTSSGQ